MKKKTGTRTHLSAQSMNPSHSTLSPKGHKRETTHLWQCIFRLLSSKKPGLPRLITTALERDWYFFLELNLKQNLCMQLTTHTCM